MTIYDEILEFVRQHGKRKPFANPHSTKERYLMPAEYLVVIDSASAMPEDAVVSITQDGKLVYVSPKVLKEIDTLVASHLPEPAGLGRSWSLMETLQLKRAMGIWKSWKRLGYLEEWKEEAV